MNVGEPGTNAHLDYLQALLAPYTRRSTDGIAEPDPAPEPEPSTTFVSPAVEEVLPPPQPSDAGEAPVIDLRPPTPQAADTVAAPASGAGRHARREPPVRSVTDASEETDGTEETDEKVAPLQRRSAQ